MKTKYIISACFIITIFATSCSQRTIEPDESTKKEEENRLVNAVGSNTYFDVATWNVENFPLSGKTTISYVAQLIRDLDVDMFGLEEMDDENSFYKLLDSLPDYNGIISTYPTDYLKLGILYKKDFISVSNVTQIYTADWYAFPRPPLVAYVEVKKENNVRFDFTFIVLHLKAMGGSENEARRRDACEKLKTYIDNNLLNSQDKDVIVLGDWNDELDDLPYNENIFKSFLDDSTNYTFLTDKLIGQASYPSFNSLIDHIMITNDALTEYGNGKIKILDLDYQFSNYSRFVSDHRPVLAQFPVLNN